MDAKEYAIVKKHTGPQPSERQLFKLWDAIEAERSQRGERAALALVNKALQAIAPADESGAAGKV